MRILLRAPLLAVASLAVLCGSVVPLGGPAAAAGPRTPPVNVRYTGSFTADLAHLQKAEYGAGEFTNSSSHVKISGTLPNVRFADARLLGSYGQGRLSVSGETGFKEATDSGDNVTTCYGKSIAPGTGVPPSLVPVAGRPTFYAFGSLSSKVDCTNSQEPIEWTEVRGLPAIPIPIAVPASKVGATVITVPFYREVPQDTCPDYAGEHSVYCVYRLKGTLTLRLVPDIDVFQAPTKARLARAAARASAVARCGTACTATITVRPLKGAGAASDRESLRPRDAKTLSVRLGSKLRKAVLRSGGARLEVTYRGGGLKRTFTRKVRL